MKIAAESEGDLFAEVHDLEYSWIQEGQREGYRDGLAAGIVEGREIGIQKGYELGLEVGFYSGCVHMWRQLQTLDPSFIPERAARGVAALEELLKTIHVDDPRDETLQDLMDKLQGRFKAVASMMGCLHVGLPGDKMPASSAAPGSLSF